MESEQRRGKYNPFFFLKEALVSMWRHRVMSIASVIVLTSCLLLLGVFWLLDVNLNANLEKLQLMNEIMVFCDNDLSQDEVDAIGSDIGAMDNVSFVEYTSKTEGLQSMRETYSAYAGLFDEMESRGDNPISDAFCVTYRDNAKVYELEYALRQIPGVKSVNNRADYAAKVESFKKGISAAFWWLLILLFAVSLFVIFNTIKIAVHGRKEEIVIMRYIGATRSFIIAPFLLEGALIGIVSGLISFFAVYGLYVNLTGKILSSMQILTLEPFRGVWWLMLPLFAAIGVLSGFCASWISLRKSLHK